MTIKSTFRSMRLTMTMLAVAVALPSFSATASESINGQTSSQLEQLKPQHFNYHSDVYRQVTYHKLIQKKVAAKRQLDSQKTMLRPQHFDPRSDVFLQMSRGA